MQVKRNPAVLAGLMGMVALVAPQTAHALSLQEASDFVLASPERAANALVKGLKGTETNEEFLIRSAKKAQQSEYVS